jgi:hypothetical protein
MNADSESGPDDGERSGEAGELPAGAGIVVEETVDVERIELAGAPDPEPGDLERLEEEQLHLAAQFAELRRASAERERELETELQAARETIASHEAELSEQVAQIASLVLECSGLRDQLKQVPQHGRDAEPAIPAPSREHEDLVDRLKQRLEERGRALALARQEIASLAQEVARLRAAAGTPAAQPVTVTPAPEEGSFSRQMLRLLRRGKEPVTADRLAARVPGEPGSEVPTVVIDAESNLTVDSGMVVVELPAPGPAAVEALRRGAQRPYAPPRPPLRVATLRRYLISLDPDDPAIHELSKPRVSVGRSAEADLSMSDTTVSRLHAVLSLQGGATVVEDASSTNGLFVNARRVSRAVLKDGDTVAFGTARFQYRVGPAPGR